MSEESGFPDNLAGWTLAAHPNLLDPTFRRTLVYISHYQTLKGAKGMILNRPLHRKLGDLEGIDEDQQRFASVPIFYGGPVDDNHLHLMEIGWESEPPPHYIDYSSYPKGIPEEVENPCFLRAFAGFAQWAPGQLEGELANKDWIVIPPGETLFLPTSNESTWKTLLQETSPLLGLLAQIPLHPENN